MPDAHAAVTTPAPAAAASAPTSAPAPVAGLQQVLAALADPVRLTMVRRLHAAGGPAPCGTLYDGIGKSTASHHFKTLREAGVIAPATSGGQPAQRLRLDDVEERHPGVLRSILAAED